MVIRDPQLHHLLKAIDCEMIYSTFQKRPYLSRLLLGLVFVIGVTWIVQAGTDIIPGRYRVRYDWLLGCLLFATTLAWMGAAALAGAVAPIGNTVMRYSYGVLLAFQLAVIASLTADRVLYLHFDTDLAWLYVFSTPIGLTLWVWMTLTGLVGALAPRNINVWAYTPLVIAPLVMSIGVMPYFLQGTWLAEQSGEGWHFLGFILLGSYGLAVFMLYRAFLSRLTWIDRLRSNLLFIPVAVFTATLATLTLVFVLLGNDGLTVALFGLLILLPSGMVTLRAMWSEQCRERQLRHLRVSVFALGIAMASYWVVMIAAVAVSIALGVVIGWDIFLPLMATMVVAVPAGYLISKMRHPYRNLLVAAIGPGLLMLMIMYFYWFDVLEKGF